LILKISTGGKCGDVALSGVCIAEKDMKKVYLTINDVDIYWDAPDGLYMLKLFMAPSRARKYVQYAAILFDFN
jgi:hypothetical protein